MFKINSIGWNLYSCKTLVLKGIKRIGGFRLVSSSTWRKNRLLILCYHGFSSYNEHIWKPELFVTSEHFEKRLKMLHSNNYNILQLSDAIKKLKQNNLPPKSVAITIDDGFHNFFSIGYPLLKKYNIKATVYVSTWHVLYNKLPVFSLMFDYLCWCGIKNKNSKYEMDKFLEYVQNKKVILNKASDDKLGKYIKNEILSELAEYAEVNWQAVSNKKILRFMSPEEIKELDPKFVDVQLHTHRHRVPRDKTLFLREIDDNRSALALCGLSPKKIIHFCYPSGVHYPEFLPWLRNVGVQSATTCVPGLANSKSDLLLLPRFIDTLRTPDIEFEAWCVGIREILRRHVRQYT
ncbi:polysaccharide deacetylase family protein [Desulfobulbus alkaliphilus]|uniref:polysaccharide deacetylase family protein n=1 Tax=Desulfobulbus alkaliphilus TaxID=869814 RepID=UPI001965C344|nr:polysaccharide deacetylase family protein [Desulfobulbus alkaliphilus]MBM9538460.1 polysaccharide deacetylase family protein [Desulfobulbus alkaliphilus]